MRSRHPPDARRQPPLGVYENTTRRQPPLLQRPPCLQRPGQRCVNTCARKAVRSQRLAAARARQTFSRPVRVATEAPCQRTPCAPLPDMYPTGTAQPTMMSAMGNSRSPADDDSPNSSSSSPSMSSRQTPRSYQPTNAPHRQAAPPSTRALHAPRPPRRLGGCRAAPATKGPRSTRPAPRRRRRAALAVIRRKKWRPSGSGNVRAASVPACVGRAAARHMPRRSPNTPPARAA